MTTWIGLAVLGFLLSAVAQAADAPPRMIAHEKTSAGDLIIEPINHSALRFEFAGKQYYIDPAGAANWPAMPKADAIFITHEHRDHLDPLVITTLRRPDTLIIASPPAAKAAGFGNVIKPGEKQTVLGITAEAIPAYNTSEDRLKFHPKDRLDVGYVLTFGDKRVYVAGDTQGTPEMRALKNIDIAFIPINLPYTMPPQEAADAVRAFKPKILYPYHQGKSDPAEMKKLLADTPEVEVRVLPLP
jgi:L-ascorbate metabolism protein UlaG (beta-lactamase superfamily)